MSRFDRNHLKRGFTLIELLVSISIIAILAALVLVVVPHVRQKAKISQCLSNMRQVGVAFQLYASDNKGFLPVQKVDNRSIYDTAGWVGQLKPYIGSYTVFQCPISEAPENSASYLYNSFASTFSLPSRSAVKANEATNPASSLLLLDTRLITTTSGLGAFIVTTVENTALSSRYPHPYGGKTNGAQSILFLDGHVELSPMGTLSWRKLQWPQ